MKVPPLIVAAALGAIISLQSWMLVKISTLAETVAGLSVKVELLANSQQLAKHDRTLQ